MSEGFVFYRCLLTLTLVLACEISQVHGTICSSSSGFGSHTWLCSYDEDCCGYDSCCSNSYSSSTYTKDHSGFVVMLGLIGFFIICCPICCYRCCCRRTTSQGFVYQQNPATTVAVTLPPQQGQPNVPYPNTMPPYPNTTPYPTTMPYPQTSPYPPQYPNNPYYGQQQPPPYTMVHEQNQQASAPAASAPPY